MFSPGIPYLPSQTVLESYQSEQSPPIAIVTAVKTDGIELPKLSYRFILCAQGRSIGTLASFSFYLKVLQ